MINFMTAEAVLIMMMMVINFHFIMQQMPKIRAPLVKLM